MKYILILLFVIAACFAHAQSDNPAANAGTSFLKVHRSGTDYFLKAGADKTLPFSNGTTISYRAIAAGDLPSLSSLYLPIGGGTLTGHLLFTDNTFDIGASGATRPRTGYFGTSVVTPLVSSSTNLSLTGTNNVSVASGNLTTVTATDSLTLVGGNTRLALEDDKGLDLYTNNTRRATIPHNGITVNTAATKALMLNSADSLYYNVVQSADFTATVTQSGSDTLQNSAICYGFFERNGNIVSLNVRIEVAFLSAGAANTFYFSPPIASNFTTEKTDVVGRGGMDTQALSSTNIPQQRCLAFASTSDDKIGITVDPPNGLAFPDNRMYISVQVRYIIQ